MELNEELRNFINALSDKTNADDELFSKEDCVKEYTAQIVEDDYKCMLEYAATTDISIPSCLTEKKYYDCEYDREVDERYIINQFRWFKNHDDLMGKDYEDFKEENFQELSDHNTPFYGIGLGI